ncbi:MAG: metal ABC transporter permease, partial [Dialister sp.]|nr:metal ABC transporter permease [Dialister sp.]
MEILSSPLWSDYTFRVVLAGTTILGILCGVLGSFIVLRREALLGDGIAHSSYPGIMLAFMFLGVKSLDGLLLGAFISALVA